MKIEFDQSGGFMGLVKTCEINSRHASTKELQVLDKLIHQADFFKVKVRSGRKSVDAIRYRLLVETEDAKREINISSDNTPQAFEPLIKYLMERAHFKRQSSSFALAR